MDWITTLSLVFGGCCSNALTLEQVTSQNAKLGTLITFSQFLIITLYGLPKFVTLWPYPRLHSRIPLAAYATQVILFYVVSLLNNAAFAYNIPMAVHIIFRSGGMVVSMILGRLLLHRRYNLMQIASVALVSIGILLTTLSASNPARCIPGEKLLSTDYKTYGTGIFLLTVALILSGFLGIAQDRMFTTYGRNLTKNHNEGSKNGHEAASWQESMFYLHFLSMPMFILNRNELPLQLATTYTGPRFHLSLPDTAKYLPNIDAGFLSIQSQDGAHALTFPTIYIPLVLNTATQLLCVAGVHRLTSQVTSLSVTLILVVRKAVSLVVSVLLFGKKLETSRLYMLWGGAILVFMGTIGYSLSSSRAATTSKSKEKKE
ncbi:hypothetical protein ABKN59_000068 [Abortiporus biennis]